MSIDVLPFSAFALESCAAPAMAAGDGQTLTLSLRPGRAGDATPIAGWLSLHASEAVVTDARHAGIARADDPPLTITF
jgi:hypothetical protein